VLEQVYKHNVNTVSTIGQVNNTLCYFGILSSFVKYTLMHTVLVNLDVSYGR